MCFKYSTRFVILFKNIVIKIPICRKGYLQAYNEKKIYKKYKQVAPLAELKWVFLGIVCQKRYEHVNEIPNSKVIEIKSLIKEFNFDNCYFEYKLLHPGTKLIFMKLRILLQDKLTISYILLLKL